MVYATARARRGGLTGAASALLDAAGALISLAATVAALILVAHIVFVVFDANQANQIVSFVAYWADRLVLFFRGIFTLPDATLQVVVDYGTAALAWLFVGRIASAVLR